MTYLLGNICTKITGNGRLLLKLSSVVGWYTFLGHSADEDRKMHLIIGHGMSPIRKKSKLRRRETLMFLVDAGYFLHGL